MTEDKLFLWFIVFPFGLLALAAFIAAIYAMIDLMMFQSGRSKHHCPHCRNYVGNRNHNQHCIYCGEWLNLHAG